jgi:hypothetical protein
MNIDGSRVSICSMKLVRLALLILFLAVVGIGAYEIILAKILLHDIPKTKEPGLLFSGDYTTYSEYEYRVHYFSLFVAAYFSVLSSYFFGKMNQFLKLRFPIFRVLLFIFGLLISWIISGMTYLTVYHSVAYSAFGIIFICIMPGISVTLIPLITFISVWIFVNKNNISKIKAVKKKTKFSLEQIKIASPCPASWKEMLGDDKVRFCNICSKNVYNLSSMTKDEAQTLIMNHQGKLCGLLYLRKDGSVMTSDCSVGFGEIRRLLIKRVVAVAGVTFALFGFQHFLVSGWDERLEPSTNEIGINNGADSTTSKG